MNRCTLDKLPLDCFGEIEKITATDDLRRRFLDFGMVNKTKIMPIFKSPTGDSRAYEVRGSIIALRKEDANKIIVNYK